MEGRNDEGGEVGFEVAPTTVNNRLSTFKTMLINVTPDAAFTPRRHTDSRRLTSTFHSSMTSSLNYSFIDCNVLLFCYLCWLINKLI